MRGLVSFSIVGSAICMFFLVALNFFLTPTLDWSIYPCIALLLWPLSMYFVYRQNLKQFAWFTSLVFLILLTVINLRETPDVLWVLYAAYPLVFWPVFTMLGRRAYTMTAAIIGAVVTSLYYALLNIAFSPDVPWVIAIIFAVGWWPLSLYHARKGSFFAYSVQASIWVSAFMIGMNWAFSPSVIWAIYPIFAVVWWPLSMYFFRVKHHMHSL
ncbi:hypothetical protein [Listeria booriae]|uniref:hypothetical protein n=1 Tax=Listeria booriae TaxID=1552123 RepID=UPI00162A8475|nr:hypothetical protein [Listeria booriae]MBC2304838.1 hypothetical protein [Listeria booriae]